MEDMHTTGSISRLLSQTDTRIRRVVDALGCCSWFGGKRCISADKIPAIEAELARRGWEPINVGVAPLETVNG